METLKNPFGSIWTLFSDSIIYHEFDTLFCNPSVPQSDTKITVPIEDIGIYNIIIYIHIS